jgi:probable rRNA maturation factor
VATWVQAAAATLGLTGEIRVRLVDDAQMSAAHERYSRVAGTTDVLTFDLRDPESAAGNPAAMDVDIYACVDEAGRQAAHRGHGVERELLLYILHGILHCLGEDDHDDAAYARMHAREDEVLEAIGVGRVFGAAAKGGVS